MDGKPFAPVRHFLEALTLEPLERRWTPQIARTLSSIDPWKTLGYTREALDSYLTRPDPALCRFTALRECQPVGVVCVRNPWLRGPYLELLAVFPGHQGMGLGSTLLEWFLAEAAACGKNAWVLVSAFNGEAARFYRARGFVETARLEDIALKGEDELLLRRRFI